LKIPQLGEIEANGGWPAQSARFYLLDEPSQPLIHGRTRLGSRIQQDLYGHGGFLDAGRSIWRSPPTAIGVLRFDHPGDSTPIAHVIYKIKDPKDGQSSGIAIREDFHLRKFLAAEPKGQAGNVETQANSKKCKAQKQIPVAEDQKQTTQISLHTASAIVNLVR